ncbi:MAG: rhomboid family intramembrane serine protease [Thermoplasmata archaeon]|nr:rhomboid family intramembrane serine protease [Thermoplasmata archaeon]
MNGWVVASIVIIIATVVYSYQRRLSYSIVASVSCGAIFVITILASDTFDVIYSSTFADLAFRPRDLLDFGRSYTVLTSMFTHAGPEHLIWNILGLAFLGTMFEQKVGTRPFIIVFMISGVCGTLAFAALGWNHLTAAVGASGAISGVLGALGRMFPNERVAFILMPTFPMPIWVFILGYLGLQLIFALGDTNIAVEAHIGGLLAGMITAPYIAKLPLHKRVKRMISLNALRRLANTPELKLILRRIEDEEIPDVRSAWIEEFLSKANCPHCGARIRVSRESITCERGHML